MWIHNPKQKHLGVTITIKYLKDPITEGLVLKKCPSSIFCAFVDDTWEKYPSDRKSTTGLLINIGESTISWESERQTVVSLSTGLHNQRNNIYQKHHLGNMHSIVKSNNHIRRPWSLYSPGHQSRTYSKDKTHWHQAHFIRGKIDATIVLQKVASQYNPADLLTNPLQRLPFHKNKLPLGIQLIGSAEVPWMPSDAGLAPTDNKLLLPYKR